MNELDRLIEKVKESEDLALLKRIRDVADRRIRELRTKKAKDWTKDVFEEMWEELSEDGKKFIKILVSKRGVAFKSEVEQEAGWKEMKITGIVAGINNRSRNLGYKDMVRREDVRRDGEWDTKYTLDGGCLQFIEEGNY
jgi:formyltetrahydrofolate hydrolase